MFAEFLMGQASQALYPWASIWLLKSTSIQPGFFFTGPISFYVTNHCKCWYSQQGFCSFVISTKSKRYPIKKVGFWHRFTLKFGFKIPASATPKKGWQHNERLVTIDINSGVYYACLVTAVLRDSWDSWSTSLGVTEQEL